MKVPNKLSEDLFQSLLPREREYIKQKLLLFTVRTLDGQTFNVIGKEQERKTYRIYDLKRKISKQTGITTNCIQLYIDTSENQLHNNEILSNLIQLQKNNLFMLVTIINQWVRRKSDSNVFEYLEENYERDFFTQYSLQLSCCEFNKNSVEMNKKNEQVYVIYGNVLNSGKHYMEIAVNHASVYNNYHYDFLGLIPLCSKTHFNIANRNNFQSLNSGILYEKILKFTGDIHKVYIGFLIDFDKNEYSFYVKIPPNGINIKEEIIFQIETVQYIFNEPCIRVVYLRNLDEITIIQNPNIPQGL